MENRIALLNVLRRCFSQDKITMNYHGIFDDEFTEKLISIAENEVDKKAKKKLALLISESFQNIVRHGDSECGEKNNSIFGIRGIDQFLHIFTSNNIDAKTKEYLEGKLNQINSLDREQMKLFYVEALEKSELSDKGGAGLGLIEIARKSQRSIQKEFKKLEDDLYVFFMQVDLNLKDEEESGVIPLTVQENEDVCKMIIDHDVVFLYKGDFSTEIMNPILSIMRQNTEATNESIGFKIFHVAVELMQNIVRHGKWLGDKNEGIFSLSKTDTGYYLCTGNYVEEGIDKIQNWVGQLNGMSKDELDELYRKILKLNAMKEGNSAGVGLIDVRRTVLTKIETRFGEDHFGKYLMIGIEIPFE